MCYFIHEYNKSGQNKRRIQIKDASNPSNVLFFSPVSADFFVFIGIYSFFPFSHGPADAERLA